MGVGTRFSRPAPGAVLRHRPRRLDSMSGHLVGHRWVARVTPQRLARDRELGSVVPDDALK